MVPIIVPNEQELFISQNTPVWCWAATSSALRNYYNKDEFITQETIARNNPIAKELGNEVITYAIVDKNIAPKAKDYLLDEVLSFKNYSGKISKFSKNEAQKLLDTGNPFALSFKFHVVIVYGYFKIQDSMFLLVFDPNGIPLTGRPFYYSSTELYESIIGDSFANIIFVKNKDTVLSAK